MFKTFNEDRNYLENKYHNTALPFDPFARMYYHGYEYDETTGLNDENMHIGLENLYNQIYNEPHAIIKAKCFAFVLDNMRIDVNSHDYFVGFYNWNRPLQFIQKKWQNAEFEADEKKKALNTLVSDMNMSGAVTMWPDYDHVVPDWDALMSLGFPGLLNRLQQFRAFHQKNGKLNDERKALFDGMEIEYKAIIRLLHRLICYAEANPSQKTACIVQALSNLICGAPQNFYEALLAIYIFFMLMEHIDNYQTRSLGNGLDQTLYPFYVQDIEKGTFTKEQIEEFLAYFFMQFSAIGNYWGHQFYMGGTDANGNSLINSLSYLILEVHEKIGIYNPKIQIKVSESTPKPFLKKILSRVRNGCGSFVFCSEKGFKNALLSYGASPAEAQNFEVSGCYETRVKANEVSTSVGYINFAKAVLYALFDGYDIDIGKQVGVKTTVKAAETFDDFYYIFLRQLDYLIDSTVTIGNELYDPSLTVINPALMYTATIEHALNKGEDAYSTGCKYNNSHILNEGFATSIDALLAVKTLIYDEKKYTIEDLKSALAGNWKGFEDLHTAVLTLKHKFGNDDEETDIYASAVAEYYAMRINNKKNARGGVYKAHMHSARRFIDSGKQTGATPDGRFSGEELSKNGSPSVGMDREGVTALLNSTRKMTPWHYTETYGLDVMLLPASVSGEEGLDILIDLINIYSEYGMAIQFNIFNESMLRDAQAHPDHYKNLQVRVCGWNVLWNNMSRDEQEAYIKRAGNLAQ